MNEQVNVQVTVDTSVAKCAENMDIIEKAANVIADYEGIIGLSSTLNTVATDLNQGDNSTIRTVSGISDDVITVAGLGSTMSTIITNSTNINAVGSDLISGDDSNILKTANNMSTISTAVTMEPAISTVVSMEPAISTTTTHITEITNVATDMHSVTTTASLAPALSTVTTNMTTITAVATDLASPDSAIKNAISAASTATTKATEASNSAHEASTKAQIATAKASNAASSATTASTAATTATSAMSTATTAATTATSAANTATSAMTTATTAATTATSAMTTATTAATTATSAMTTATTQATLAESYKNTAISEANRAETQANLARRYAQETHGASDVTFSNLRALPAINNYEYPQTDEDGLNDLIEEYHSTFDLSKFTVVGSPTITADGIFTGASSSAVECPISISNGQKTVIKLSYKHKNGTNPQFLFCTLDNNENSKGLFIYADTNNDINVFYNNTTHTVDNFDLIENTEYALELKTDYKTYVTLIIDGVEKYNATGLSLAYGANNNAILGNNAVIANNRNILGSLELKQFSITVDGVEVFSGNQTGIDTIKPDNYTVVGTPTITTDGIASGFSASNYLTTTENINLTSSKSVQMKFHFKTSSDVSTRQMILLSNTYNQFSLEVWGSDLRLGCGKNNTWVSDNPLIINSSVQANTDYYLIFDFTSSGVNYAWSTDNSNWTTGTNATYTFLPDIYDMTLRVGLSRNATSPFLGSIDLNAFKIYVNGDLVYQPCLKIPYTQSKTGLKIVDSVYRDRVQDMYEQFGYAPYFTLKEDGLRYAKPVFEKEGNPTLVNGVASGFSASDYFTTPLTFEGAWTFSCKFNVSESASGHNFVLISKIATIQTNKQIRILTGSSSGAVILGSSQLLWQVNISKNTNYLLTISYDGTQTYTTVLKNLDNSTSITDTVTDDSFFASGTDTWVVGAPAYDLVGQASPFDGSIDLNSLNVKLETDYYQNFTTPQGSTYGYLQKLTRQNITDTTSTSVTLAKAKGNTDYHYGTLTSLTITANETSDYETNIYFTAGNSISVSLPNTLNYIGTTPSFSASTSYVMSILNNILVVGEIA